MLASHIGGEACSAQACFRRHAWQDPEIYSERYTHVHVDSLHSPRCEWLRDVLWKTQTVIEVDDKLLIGRGRALLGA